jgi:hypothetical protein
MEHTLSGLSSVQRSRVRLQVILLICLAPALSCAQAQKYQAMAEKGEKEE